MYVYIINIRVYIINIRVYINFQTSKQSKTIETHSFSMKNELFREYFNPQHTSYEIDYLHN